MRKTIVMRLLAAVSLSLGYTAVPAVADPTLVYDGTSQLAGVTGLTVGTLGTYDVNLAGGSCLQAFGTCEASNFAFNSSVDATAAGNALLSVIGSTDPSLMAGCNASGQSFCQVMIPYGATDTGLVYVAAADNYRVGLDQVDFVTEIRADLVNYGMEYAVFTLEAPSVPEPTTWTLMLVGFGGMGLAMRRKRGPQSLAHVA